MKLLLGLLIGIAALALVALGNCRSEGFFGCGANEYPERNRETEQWGCAPKKPAGEGCLNKKQCLSNKCKKKNKRQVCS
jgi:hypothetical protein